MTENQTFQYPLIILEKHLDTFGHVNNAVYLEILEEARWDIITKNGFGIDKIQKGGIGPVILEIKIRFMKELKLRQKILIRTQILSSEGKISLLRQWIENEKGETSAEAELKIGLFDIKSRKLIPQTTEWKNALGIKE